MEKPTETAVETKEVPAAATEPTAPVTPQVTPPEVPKETPAEVKAEETVDYKAELEASLAQNAKLAQERDNYRKAALIAKGKRPDDGRVIVADKAEIQKMVDERIAAQVPMTGSPVDRTLDELTSDPDERALIKHIYDTRITHTGTDVASLKNDLEEAQLLANKKTVKKTISELRAAAQRRPTAGSGAGSSTAQTAKPGDKDFTPEQLAYFAKRGLDPEKVRANLNRVPGIGNK